MDQYWPVAAFDGELPKQFGGVVAYAVFEDNLYFFYVIDVDGGVAVDDDEVGVFANGYAADGGLFAFVGGAVEGSDFDGFERGEAAGVDEELDFALVAEAGKSAAVAGGIEACYEEATSVHEFVFGVWCTVVVDERLFSRVGFCGRLSSWLRV